MLEIELTDQRGRTVTETATKPSPAPLQKHSVGGCTIDMPPSNFRRRGRTFRRAMPCYMAKFHGTDTNRTGPTRTQTSPHTCQNPDRIRPDPPTGFRDRVVSDSDWSGP